MRPSWLVGLILFRVYTRLRNSQMQGATPGKQTPGRIARRQLRAKSLPAAIYRAVGEYEVDDAQRSIF
jgi:uncharacterized RDD family membrane protein YckC